MPRTGRSSVERAHARGGSLGSYHSGGSDGVGSVATVHSALIPLLLRASDSPDIALLAGGRYTEPRTKLPQERWAIIRAKRAEGATLRSIAADEGVSYEAVRQVLRRTPATMGSEVAR